MKRAASWIPRASSFSIWNRHRAKTIKKSMLLVIFTLIPVMLIISVKFEHVAFQYRHLSATGSFYPCLFWDGLKDTHYKTNNKKRHPLWNFKKTSTWDTRFRFFWPVKLKKKFLNLNTKRIPNDVEIKLCSYKTDEECILQLSNMYRELWKCLYLLTQKFF